MCGVLFAHKQYSIDAVRSPFSSVRSLISLLAFCSWLSFLQSSRLGQAWLSSRRCLLQKCPPQKPQSPTDPGGWAQYLLLGIVMGGMAGIFVVIARSTAKNTKARSAAARDLRQRSA